MPRDNAKQNDEKKLREILAVVYERRRSQITVSPSWLATEAMLEIDPAKIIQINHPLAYLAAHLEMRQLARSLCRGKFDDDADDREIDDLFPLLQKRYPTAHSANQVEPKYILRAHMSDEDIDYNMARLRQESMAKQEHADALEDFKRRRKVDVAV